LRTGYGDAARFLDEVAALADGNPPAQKPLSPLIVKRPLDPGEQAQHFPRAQSGAVRMVGEIARVLEPYAPALLVEVTGQIPRGDLLPDANPAALRARAVATALALEPLRVYVDPPGGREVRLCADGRLALAVGGGLVSPGAQARLTFETARALAWTAAGATVGAFLTGAQLPAFLQAVGTDAGDEDVRELRRRVLRPLPRKIKKDLERVIGEQLPALARAAGEWHAEEQRWADRIAFLLTRDVTAAFESMAGDKPLSASPRVVELVRYLASENCWRTYARLTA
jgi:hypothetical protein